MLYFKEYYQHMTNPSLQWTVPPFLEDLKVSSYLRPLLHNAGSWCCQALGNYQFSLVFSLFVLCCLHVLLYCLTLVLLLC